MKHASTRVISQTPTISTDAYEAGDVVGGVQHLQRALALARGGILQSLTVKEKGTQADALTILLFRSEPGSVAADNAAFTLADADLAECVGVIEVAADDFVSVGSASVATIRPELALEGKKSSKKEDAGDLWAVVVAVGTPTYTSASDLVFEYGFRPDSDS